MRQKFQYLIARLDDGKPLADFLSQHGAQGWRYIRQEPGFCQGRNFTEYTFIRRVSLFDRLFRRA